jgi:hypothetical protein
MQDKQKPGLKGSHDFTAGFCQQLAFNNDMGNFIGLIKRYLSGIGI